MIGGQVACRVGRALVARAPVAMLATPGAEHPGAETLPGPRVVQGVVPAAIGLPGVLGAATTRAAGDDTTDRAQLHPRIVDGVAAAVYSPAVLRLRDQPRERSKRMVVISIRAWPSSLPTSSTAENPVHGQVVDSSRTTGGELRARRRTRPGDRAEGARDQQEGPDARQGPGRSHGAGQVHPSTGRRATWLPVDVPIQRGHHQRVHAHTDMPPTAVRAGPRGRPSTGAGGNRQGRRSDPRSAPFPASPIPARGSRTSPRRRPPS